MCILVAALQCIRPLQMREAASKILQNSNATVTANSHLCGIHVGADKTTSTKESRHYNGRPTRIHTHSKTDEFLFKNFW